MKKSKLLRWAAAVIGIATVAGVSFAAYLWFMPHRDVQSRPPDLWITTTDLIDRYLSDAPAANAFFLKEDGNSKILALTGAIREVKKNQAGATVIRIAEPDGKAGALCVLTEAASAASSDYTVGSQITLKGAIRAGPTYDDLIGIYVDAVMDDCAPYQN